MSVRDSLGLSWWVYLDGILGYKGIMNARLLTILCGLSAVCAVQA